MPKTTTATEHTVAINAHIELHTSGCADCEHCKAPEHNVTRLNLTTLGGDDLHSLATDDCEDEREIMNALGIANMVPGRYRMTITFTPAPRRRRSAARR